MRDINSAFFAKLQLDGGQITELIDVFARNMSFHWTTNNQPLLATLSGDLIQYDPFPGNVPTGILESSDLAISVVDFVIANSGGILRKLLGTGDFSYVDLVASRVFIDTPDLGRMNIYAGKVGDYVYDRVTVAGQARNLFQSLSVQWPYYTYQDTCVWRFGSPPCGITASSFGFSYAESDVNPDFTTTSAITVNTGTLTNTWADGRFDFGRLTITAGVNSGVVRTIRRHIGDTLFLSHPLPVNSMSGVAFDIAPGCKKRLIEDCTSLYNNAENAMLFPWIPVQEQVVTV